MLCERHSRAFSKPEVPGLSLKFSFPPSHLAWRFCQFVSLEMCLTPFWAIVIAAAIIMTWVIIIGAHFVGIRLAFIFWFGRRSL